MYKDVHLNHDCLDSLPESDVPSGLSSLQTILSDDTNSDSTILPGVQDFDEDLSYNEDTEMASFLPFLENQKLFPRQLTGQQSGMNI